MSLASILVLALAAASAVAGPGPSVGFVEEWSTDTRNWGDGGTTLTSNPGTGGLLGAGDGFLLMTSASATPDKFGAFAVDAYTGDWVAAGIHSVKLWLNDVNTDEPFEVHFVIGASHVNLWQYNEGFQPPHNAWGQFVVDLTDSAKFTRFSDFVGPTSFREALQNVDRIHLRHDLAPYDRVPDNISGDLGVDHLELSDERVPSLSWTWGRLKALYR